MRGFSTPRALLPIETSPRGYDRLSHQFVLFLSCQQRGPTRTADAVQLIPKRGVKELINPDLPDISSVRTEGTTVGKGLCSDSWYYVAVNTNPRDMRKPITAGKSRRDGAARLPR